MILFHSTIDQPMQYSHTPMDNSKLQKSYNMTTAENDTMNMTPLCDSLYYSRDNNFNFSHTQHTLPNTITMASQKNWSERILQDIFGLLHILSPSGKILYCSESCIELIGYYPHELIGKSLTDFLHTDDLYMFNRNLQIAFNTMTRVKIHYRFRRKDNTYLLLESIGQPKQDTPDQVPQLLFAIAQPLLSKNNDSLDSFLEMKMENEWLRKRLHEMMLTQEESPISVSADTSYYQQQQMSLHQLQQNNNPYITDSNSHEQQSGLSNSNNYQHHLSDRNLNTHNNLDYHNEFDVHYYPPQTYPTTTTTAAATTTVAPLFDSNNNDLLLGPSAQYYMKSNDSPEFSSRRPSSCSSTMFQTNNNNYNNTSTTTDDNTNNNWNTGYNYSPSVASSVEVNEMMARYQQQEEPLLSSASAINNADGLATTSSYLSSNNSTTTANTDITKIEKWKRRKKSRGTTDDYVCADCGTTTSPEWRKGPQGPKTLCNACGLRWAKKNKKI